MTLLTASSREGMLRGRFIFTDYFDRRPKLTANTGNIDANKYFEATGTNVTEPTFLAGGGINLLTAAGASDQVLLTPIAATAFAVQRFYPDQLPYYGALLRVPTANFQTTGLYWGGLMDTPTDPVPGNQTDAAYWDFNAGIPRAVYVIAGVDTTVEATSVALSAGDYAKMEIIVDDDRRANFYYNNRLVTRSPALTAGTDLILNPWSVQGPTGGAATGMQALCYSVGRLYSGGNGTGAVTPPA